jgi:APA family basic amino acid/polyamine antiporter
MQNKSIMVTKPVAQMHAEYGANPLKRSLGPVALTALGIGGIIGTGIFVLTGLAAAQHAGPAIVISFVIAALGCAFAALCYAEFAAMVPVAGSAYAYSYATLGEFIAWFVGWNLVLEYAVAVSTVSVGWSRYFVKFLDHYDINFLPAALTAAPFNVAADGVTVITTGALMNLPAVFIVAFVSAICYVGITQSSFVNAVIVAIKVSVIILVIGFGAYYVNPDNWTPFIPENTGPGQFGWSGILRASGIIFFAYIGFDAVSTAAQEATNPARDMPIGIIASLIVCTVLYILMAAVLTGMLPYPQLNDAAPVAVALMAHPGLDWLVPLVLIGAIAGITSVALVMSLAQARIFLAMSRDGLLFRFMGKVHPKYKTPYLATVVTGLFAGTMGGLLPVGILGELVSIGTLIAFVVVCIGILILRQTRPDIARPFRAPAVWITAPLGVIFCGIMMLSLPAGTWWRLVIWTAIGLVLYFGYGYRNSVLRKGQVSATGAAAPARSAS